MAGPGHPRCHLLCPGKGTRRPAPAPPLSGPIVPPKKNTPSFPRHTIVLSINKQQLRPSGQKRGVPLRPAEPSRPQPKPRPRVCAAAARRGAGAGMAAARPPGGAWKLRSAAADRTLTWRGARGPECGQRTERRVLGRLASPPSGLTRSLGPLGSCLRRVRSLVRSFARSRPSPQQAPRAGKRSPGGAGRRLLLGRHWATCPRPYADWWLLTAPPLPSSTPNGPALRNLGRAQARDLFLSLVQPGGRAGTHSRAL